MEPIIPMRFLPRLACGTLCAFLISLVALVGCGGASFWPSEEATAEKEKTEKETTEEVGRLAVRDAVGQMFVVGMGGAEPEYYIEKMVRERNIGGVLLFGYNMESEEQTRGLVARAGHANGACHTLVRYGGL